MFSGFRDFVIRGNVIELAVAVVLAVVPPMERMEGEAAVTTKACAECTSDIPLAARRCPMCTAVQGAAA